MLNRLKIIVAAVVWGAAYPLTKLILDDVPPIFVGFLRFATAALIFSVGIKSMPLGGIAKEDRKTFAKMGFWGVFALIIGMNYGLIWTPGILASILSGTPPFFAVILAAIILKEKIRPVHFAAIALALTGCVFLGDNLSLSTDLEPWKLIVGTILVTIPQFSWAMYGIIGKQAIANYPWQYVCRDSFALGALMLLPFAAIEVAVLGFGLWSTKTILILLYLAIMNSIVTYSLWNSALKTVSITTANFLIYVQPITGAIISNYLFNEKIRPLGYLGISLIFISLTTVLLTEKQQAEQARQLIIENG